MVRFLGIFGLVLLGFGIVSGFIIGSFTLDLVIGHLILGAVSLALWGALVGVKNIGTARQVISGRTTRYGVNAILYTAVFLGVVGSINWIVQRHNPRWDLTAEKVYSLSPQSQKVIEDLNKPLTIVAFKGVSDDEARTQDLLRRYKDQNSGKVTLETIDPRAKPHLWSKYGMKAGNQVYLAYGTDAGASVSRVNEVTEQSITNAVIKLTQNAAKKVYFVYGHGETNIENAKADGMSQAIAAVKDERLTAEPLLLAQAGTVPEDAAAVVLAAPQTPLRDREKKALIEYAEAGGRLLLLTEPRTTSDVKEIAAAFGIKVGDDIIVDQVQKMMSGPELGFEILALDYDKANPITKDFTQQNATVFNTASSVSKLGDGIKGAQYWPIVKSSAFGWAETDLASVFDAEQATVKKDESDIPGPISIAIAYEKPVQENSSPQEGAKKMTRVVVYGDSSWVWNASFRYDATRNLFLNSLNWVAGEEGGITIRPGEMKPSQNPIPQNTVLRIFLTSLLAPELIFLVGLWIWWRRRMVTGAAV